MSRNLESQIGVPEGSVFNQRVSRRGFLRGAVLAAAGLAAMRYSPASAAPSEGPRMAEAAPVGGWGELPIVSGEPAIEGRVVMPEAGVMRFDNGMNSRDSNTTVGTAATPRQAGTYFEVRPGEEHMDDAVNDPRYTWTGGDVVLDPKMGVIENPADREHIYVANNQGNTTLLTDADQLPVELQDLYRESGEVLQSQTQLVATDFIDVFNNFGGTESFSNTVSKAWGVKLRAGETFTETTTESPLRAWQLAVSIAAAGVEEGDTSELVDIGQIAGETSAIKFYRKANGDSVDVIGRVVNPEADTNADVFVISRFVADEKEGQIVKAIGFTTPEGFATAYPELVEIAPELTAMTGEGVEDLMGDIADLDQTQVFLAELNAFAPKVETENGESVRYTNDTAYKATRYDAKSKQTGKYLAYMHAPGEAEWMTMYERVDELPEATQAIMTVQAQKYAEAHGADIENMQTELKVITGKDGQPFTVVVGHFPVVDAQFSDLYRNIPLVVTKQEAGEVTWERASLANILEKCGIKAGMNMDKDYAFKSPSFTSVLKEDCSQITITQGDLLWKWAEPTQGEHERWGATDMQRLIQEAQRRGTDKELTVQHLLFPEQYPDWVVNGSFERKTGETEAQAYERIIRDRITYMAKYNNAVNRWTVVNEPYFNGRTIGENWVRDDVMSRKIGPNYIRRAFEIAREVLGEDEVLIYNDTVNQALSGRQNGLYGQLTVQNLRQIEGLVDIAGMQMHLDGSVPPTKAEVVAAMQGYAQYTKLGVEITEMDVDLSSVAQPNRFLRQAEVYKTIVEAALESGVTRAISFWDIGDKNSWYEVYMNKPQADATLFTDTLEPKPAYFAVMQAAIEHVMQS